MKFGFFGIIPSNLRHCKEIKFSSKVLYSEIMAFLEPDGTCIKNNAFFTRVLGIGKSTISNCLTELRNYGFIKVTIDFEKGTHKYLKRYITPTSFTGGVNHNIKSTYSENLGEVNNNASLEGTENHTNLEQTLLLHNNTLNKRYIDGVNRHTPINKSINEKQANALREIARSFYSKQKSRYPNMVDKEPDIGGSINTLYQLITIDGFDYESVRDSIAWAIESTFWSSTLFSLKTLRSKGNNGLSKFKNLHHQYKNQ